MMGKEESRVICKYQRLVTLEFLCEHFQTTLTGARPKKQQPVGRQSGDLTCHTLTALQDAAGPCRERDASPSRLVSSSLSPTHDLRYMLSHC